MTKKFKTYEEAIRNINEIDLTDLDQLKLIDPKTGLNVALYLASKGKFPEKYLTKEILKLSSPGWEDVNVAKLLALRSELPKRFMVPDILLLEANGKYVYMDLQEYKDLTLGSAKNTLELYLLAMTKYRYPKIDFSNFEELVNKYGLDKMKQMIKLTGEK